MRQSLSRLSARRMLRRVGHPRRPAGVDAATRRYLMYMLAPGWLLPGLLDYRMHRRTGIEHAGGIRESLIHSLMMTEVGVPVWMALLLDINPGVLALMGAAALVHEGTAAWDVRTAVDAGREVTPAEQLVHSFLESLPFTALASLACLHWDQLRAVPRDWRDPALWRFRRKHPRLPGPYLASLGAAVVAFGVIPYAEELIRCVRARRERGRDAGAGLDAAGGPPSGAPGTAAPGGTGVPGFSRSG